MVSKRNRILELVEFYKSLGIEVNLKNKARGNKGFFKTNGKGYRIDVSHKLDETAVLSVLIHEFAHYFHYLNDKTLKDLSFIIDNNETILEELLNLTVDEIPKDFAENLFCQKDKIKKEIKTLTTSITETYPNFKLSKPFLLIEKDLKKNGLSCLIKHDRVKLITGFSYKLYSIDNLSQKLPQTHLDYLLIKSKQRALNRINSKILFS